MIVSVWTSYAAALPLIRVCIIKGKFTIIKDCAKIADNTFVPPNTVIPALSLFAGSPGRFAEDLPESTQELVEAMTKRYYTRFQPDPNEPPPNVRR